MKKYVGNISIRKMMQMILSYINNSLQSKSDTTHTHDNRYYTEAETNNLLNGKSNTSHTHDERYYTESEVNNLLSTKSSTSHNHDNIYSKLTHNHDALYSKLGHIHLGNMWSHGKSSHDGTLGTVIHPGDGTRVMASVKVEETGWHLIIGCIRFYSGQYFSHANKKTGVPVNLYTSHCTSATQIVESWFGSNGITMGEGTHHIQASNIEYLVAGNYINLCVYSAAAFQLEGYRIRVYKLEVA